MDGMVRSRIWLVGLLLFPLFAGCVRSKVRVPGTAKIEGRVTVDGQPISFGTVTFLPEVPEELGGRPGIARIESDGSYRIGNANPEKNMLLKPGRYRVTVLAMEPITGSKPTARMVSPPLYSDYRSTPLEFSVVDGVNRIDLKLARSVAAADKVNNR